MTRARLIPLVAPVLVVVGLWAVAVATTGSSARADERIGSAVDELASFEVELDEIRLLEDPDVAAQLVRRIARSEAAIPDTVDLASVLAEIARLGEVHDVTVEQLAPGIGSDADGAQGASGSSEISTVSLALSGRGSYSAIMEFLEDVGQSDRLVIVTYVQLAAIDGVETLVFDATLEVFTTATLTSDAGIGLDGLDDAAEDLG